MSFFNKTMKSGIRFYSNFKFFSIYNTLYYVEYFTLWELENSEIFQNYFKLADSIEITFNCSTVKCIIMIYMYIRVFANLKIH